MIDKLTVHIPRKMLRADAAEMRWRDSFRNGLITQPTTEETPPMSPVDFAQRTTTEPWNERKAPELFKFEHEGDEVIGFLRKCFREPAEGKNVPTYMIETDNHELLKVRATYDLLQKLSMQDVGMRIRIRYDGEQETANTREGNNRLRKFSVWVKPGPPRPQNNPEATDEDIPF